MASGVCSDMVLIFLGRVTAQLMRLDPAEISTARIEDDFGPISAADALARVENELGMIRRKLIEQQEREVA